MHTLKLTQIGNSVGVILPKEILARLKVEKGDVIYLTESADGMRLTWATSSMAACERGYASPARNAHSVAAGWPSTSAMWNLE